MSILIGIHGKARSGKDTFASCLQNHLPFRRMSFAAPLKAAVAGLFNIPVERAFSDDKEQNLEGWGLTLRDVLQRFGTEALRGTFGDDFWVDRWYLEYMEYMESSHPNVVLTDLRFPNEAKRVRMLGGVVVHLVRPGAGLTGASGAHASEQTLPVEVGDYWIVNEGSLEDLDMKAGALLRSLGARK